ncbi:MAG: nucleoside hydrolase [Planctomycetaceae bacterium]|jgi:purine nucleosidase|nr:nucleoside hydrolase [Planctomycetaceae bacterium]
MPKKILLDIDPGVVDALAFCVALFDSSVDVIAVTSVGGNIPAPVSARNLQALLEFIDPPRLPRIGMGTLADIDLPIDFSNLYGDDGLCGVSLPVAELRMQHPAEKVICDAIRSDPENVMIICLGPLTNIARAFIRDPELPNLVRHIYISGGVVSACGNVTPCAEFNIYADPIAAKTVLDSQCMKTIVPLDVTGNLVFTLDDVDKLAGLDNCVGQFYRGMLLPVFRAYRQHYGIEGIYVHDLIAYMAATRPEYAETEEMPCEIETSGTITRGVTVFDRRHKPEWKNNTYVVTTLNDPEIIIQDIITLLNSTAEKCIKNKKNA